MLDNPIWHSLATSHAHLALGADVGQGLARRYPSDIGPLSALSEPTPQAYADLAALIPEDDVAVLFLHHEPTPVKDWLLLRAGSLIQMVCPTIPRMTPSQGSLPEPIIPLGPADYAEMLALAALTEPGPFRENTATLGGFLGIRVKGRLAAMAGQRLSPTGWSEVSAVCAHPDVRGRGFAEALVAAVTSNIYAHGRLPFLTSYEANHAAIRIYQKVGFIVRRTFHLAVLKPPAPSA